MLWWDQAAMMPAGGAEMRAEQLAELKLIRHELVTHPTVEELIGAAESEPLDDWQRANLAEMRRRWLNATALEPRLVEAWSRATSDGEMAWRTARPRSDFASARPALERADQGIYPEAKLQGVGPEREDRYFAETAEGGFRIRDEVKRLVIYDFHNLKHENGLRDLDVVFCRNVLIYFDPEEQERVVAKLVRALKPGGYLFLGHSESVQGKIEDLKFVHHGRGTAYRKVMR